jgi:hypothetical protein
MGFWGKVLSPNPNTQDDFTVSSMCQVVDGSTGFIRSFLGFFEPKESSKKQKEDEPKANVRRKH